MQESDGERLNRGLETVRQYVADLSLSPETSEVAELIYQQALTSPDVSLVGRGVAVIAASAVHIACRQTGDVRTANEIAATTESPSVDDKRVHRTTKYLSSQLGIGLVVADPKDFVDRIGEKLNAPDEDIALAKHLVDILKEDGIAVNQAANTIAATAFYYVGAYDRSHGRYTQKEVSEAGDLSALTIRNNYRDYCEVLSEDDVQSFYDNKLD